MKWISKSTCSTRKWSFILKYCRDSKLKPRSIKLTDLKDLFDSEGEDDEVDEDKEENEIEMEGEIVKDEENEDDDDEEEEDSSSSSSSSSSSNDDEQPRSKKSRKAPPTISKQIQQSTSFKPSLSSDFFADL